MLLFLLITTVVTIILSYIFLYIGAGDYSKKGDTYRYVAAVCIIIAAFCFIVMICKIY